MLTTFVSRGGPTADRLVAVLGERFPVYQPEPGVWDVYSDSEAPLFAALREVTPSWATHLQLHRSRPPGEWPSAEPTEEASSSS
jgi:hypothetical protein